MIWSLLSFKKAPGSPEWPGDHCLIRDLEDLSVETDISCSPASGGWEEPPSTNWSEVYSTSSPLGASFMPGPGRGTGGLEMIAQISPRLERPAEEEERVTKEAVCTQTAGL